MVETTEQRMLRQLKLEEEARGLGIKRYRERVAKQPTTDSRPANKFMQKFLPTIAEEVAGVVERFSRGNPSQKTQAEFLAEFEDRYEQVALLALRSCVMNVQEEKALTNVSISLASRLQDEIDYKLFEKQEPKLYHWMRRDSASLTSDRIARTRFRRTLSRFGKMGERGEYEDKVKLAVGVRLINIIIRVTGAFKVEKVTKRGRSVNYLKATEGMHEWINEAHNRCEALSPLFLPMLVEPKEWDSPVGGGYWGPLQHSVRFVKTRDKDMLEELKNTDMPKVYGAINALQRTAWKVNTSVLNVLKQVWDDHLDMGDLPSRHDTPLPARPADIDTNAESLRLWKYAATYVYTKNGKVQSKRAQVAARIWAAEKFAGEETIYLPWSVDWRGRAYPVSTILNPQGDDLSKSLLMFAKGKPLGETGGYWLAVHIAGLFGVDKVSFDERVEWVQDNTEAIMDSAMNPIEGDRFWEHADKPWSALAACYEWLGFMIQGNGYVSHLPIAMDGSCNGLQHFSAMLRDEVGGTAVNLVPGKKPADVYTEVMHVAERQVIKDADAGDENAVIWLGKLSRKIVKRPVMTLPYGAGQYGMRDQVAEEVRKHDEKSAEPLLGDADVYQACGYLAKVVYQAIGEVVVAARAAMNWLQDTARLAAKDGLPIHWITPVGFPVIQAYNERKSTRVEILLGRQRLQLSLQHNTDKLNKKRQAQGISPNFVHSTDAAHMMSTVLTCLENGIEDFAMIHDSYGCHACDSEIMFAAIRESFVEQYSQPVLEDFRQQIIQQLPKDKRDQVEPLPQAGKLDLSGVLDSQYFFA